MFQKNDPRHVIDKRATIVIYRSTSPTGESKVSLGYVETKHEYFVSTDFPKPYSHLGADKDWPEDWYWTYLNIEKQDG